MQKQPDDHSFIFGRPSQHPGLPKIWDEHAFDEIDDLLRHCRQFGFVPVDITCTP
jgi:hypothetical protein